MVNIDVSLLKRVDSNSFAEVSGPWPLACAVREVEKFRSPQKKVEAINLESALNPDPRGHWEGDLVTPMHYSTGNHSILT